MWFAPLVIGQLAMPVGQGPALQPELAAAAAASPRPVACAAGAQPGPDRVSALWSAARQPGVRRFCHELARGYAALGHDPKAALEHAERADKALPGRAASQVLAARAALSLGNPEAAWKRFAAARKLERRSTEAPATLHDLAVAAARTGHRKEAVRAYRALAPRAGLLASAARRQRVYVEAGVTVMGDGPEALNEAVGYLSEARRRGSPPGMSQYVLGALALALDRQGRTDEARGVAAEAEGPWALARALPEGDPADDEEGANSSDEAGDASAAGRALLPAAIPLLPTGELHAMVAILATREDPELARSEWEAFLEVAPDSPWAAHARAWLARLG